MWRTRGSSEVPLVSGNTGRCRHVPDKEHTGSRASGTRHRPLARWQFVVLLISRSTPLQAHECRFQACRQEEVCGCRSAAQQQRRAWWACRAEQFCYSMFAALLARAARACRRRAHGKNILCSWCAPAFASSTSAACVGIPGLLPRFRRCNVG